MSVLCCAVFSLSVMTKHHEPIRPLCTWGFSRQEYWSGLPYPPPEGLRNAGIDPSSPALQADSLLSAPQERPWILEWVAYLFSKGSSWPRNQTRISCISGRFFTSWATREAIYIYIFLSLVGELRFPKPCGQRKKKKTWTWMITIVLLVIATKQNFSVQIVTYSCNRMLVINMKQWTISIQTTWVDLKSVLNQRRET